MSFLNKIFSGSNHKDLIDESPFLSPWYLRGNTPKLLKNGESLIWNHIDKLQNVPVVVVTLQDSLHNCFGIITIKSNTYIQPIENNTGFLIWNRAKEIINGKQVLNIHLYRNEQLKPIERLNEVIFKVTREEISYYFPNPPISSIMINLDPSIRSQKIDFPDEFKNIPDFIVIKGIIGLYQNSKHELNSTAFIEVQPNSSSISIYPQDWFNKGPMDFMYQWITRAVRDKKTGLIHGHGIRIDDFILDESGTQIKEFVKS